MLDKNYNNDFFGWNGSISRKNYAINIFIVLSLYVVLTLINFKAFEPYVTFKFLLSILIFIADLLKLILVMCALSLVYRRIADFAIIRTYKFQMNMKKLFIFLYVFPALYLLCIRYFLDFIPVLINITDIITFMLLLPGALITAVIFCFIK